MPGTAIPRDTGAHLNFHSRLIDMDYSLRNKESLAIQPVNGG